MGNVLNYQMQGFCLLLKFEIQSLFGLRLHAANFLPF